jgi:signal-transduction protein with cAMP-binding, CBS, and nucleotidyltransferase domain
MDISVSSIMLSKVITSPVTSNLKTVAQKIIDEDAGSVLISDNQDIIGIITEKDLLRAVLQHKDFETTKAGDVMTSPLDCCDAEDSLEKCMELFEKTGRTRLVVMKAGKAVGVIRRKILERFLNTAKRYSLAGIAKTPRFRTGRG